MTTPEAQPAVTAAEMTALADRGEARWKPVLDETLVETNATLAMEMVAGLRAGAEALAALGRVRSYAQILHLSTNQGHWTYGLNIDAAIEGKPCD